MPTVYLAYGSNMGDRRKNINDAVDLLNKSGIKITKVSTPIETKPLGGVAQALYLNGVLAGETKLSPLKLLQCTKEIEQKLGRVSTIKNGPRPIDLDILLYGNKKIKNTKLQIPHPQIAQRNFVINPLKELAPNVDLKSLC